MGSGEGRPGRGGAAGGEDLCAGPRVKGERHDGSGRVSFKAEGLGPSCRPRALLWPVRSRGFTRSLGAGAGVLGRGWLGRVGRWRVAGTCKAALRWGAQRHRGRSWGHGRGSCRPRRCPRRGADLSRASFGFPHPEFSDRGEACVWPWLCHSLSPRPDQVPRLGWVLARAQRWFRVWRSSGWGHSLVASLGQHAG